jgi:hypothetical protein
MQGRLIRPPGTPSLAFWTELPPPPQEAAVFRPVKNLWLFDRLAKPAMARLALQA